LTNGVLALPDRDLPVSFFGNGVHEALIHHPVVLCRMNGLINVAFFKGSDFG
jgi:hypothetical protein